MTSYSENECLRSTISDLEYLIQNCKQKKNAGMHLDQNMAEAGEEPRCERTDTQNQSSPRNFFKT